MSEQKTRPTKEEVEARKAEMIGKYQDQMPFLEAQFKYENLLTQIQQAHTDRLEAEYKWIQIKAAMEGMLTEPETKADEKAPAAPTMTAHRTLKKEQDADK